MTRPTVTQPPAAQSQSGQTPAPPANDVQSITGLGPAWQSLPADAAAEAGSEQPISPIPQPQVADPRRVALGEKLFSDVRLSGDGRHSCASCHDLFSNGASPHAHDLNARGQALAFNTPTVFNAALSFRMNWEGGLRTLTDQARVLLSDGSTMGLTPAEIVAKLNGDAATVAEFRAAFKRAPDLDALAEALASFEATLLTPDSRFDRWLRGDAAALSAEEVDGYATFRTLGCISCHQGVGVGGNLFQHREVFNQGIVTPPDILRVPSLRNVATTAPYFHDGRAATLEEAVQTMAAAQLGRVLSPEQVGGIVAFLRTLTGEYRGKPLHAP